MMPRHGYPFLAAALGEPLKYLAELVSFIPVRLRSLLLVLSLTALGYLVWRDFRPAAVVAQFNGHLSSLDARVSMLEQQQTDIFHMLSHQDDMQRWMCFQNERNATLAGIPCDSLGIRTSTRLP